MVEPLNLFERAPENGQQYVYVLAERDPDGLIKISIKPFVAQDIVYEECEGIWFLDVPGVLKKRILIGSPEYHRLLDRMFFFPYSEDVERQLLGYAEKSDVAGFYAALGRKVPQCLERSKGPKSRSRDAVYGLGAPKPPKPGAAQTVYGK